MENVEIAKMSIEDLPFVCEIEQKCFSVPFKKEDFISYLNDPYWNFLVAKVDGVVVGYLSYIVLFSEATLVNVAVLPEYRGKKIGQALLHELVMIADSSELTSICLEVRKSNQVAINLYTKYGFVTVGVSKNHYSLPTEDALRMNLTL